MVARAFLSSYPAPLHASGESPAKSNHSRTYGIPRGGGIYRFPCQTNPPLRQLFAVSSTVSSSITPFPASLTQKQGDTAYWSYYFSSLSVVDCRLLAFRSFPPPCPTSHFPLQWEIPFPVTTGEKT